MREKKRLSDDMMEFIISQLKFKKATDWLGGAQSKVGKWMRTADKDALTVNDRQKIKTVLSIMNKELK